jgi:hypothetical protein
MRSEAHRLPRACAHCNSAATDGYTFGDPVVNFTLDPADRALRQPNTLWKEILRFKLVDQGATETCPPEDLREPENLQRHWGLSLWRRCHGGSTQYASGALEGELSLSSSLHR